MSILTDKFKMVRLDQSPYLFHFIKGTDPTPFNTLETILNEQQLKSTNNYICFSGSPVTQICDFFKVKTNTTGAPLYSSFGIGIDRDILIKNHNARNVIYTDGKENIPAHLLWRTMKLNVDNYDFEYLREWRIQGNKFDFSMISKDKIVVIAPTQIELNPLITKFHLKYQPVVNIEYGDIEPDWDCDALRNWKGISLDDIKQSLKNDYALKETINLQKIGDDMEQNLCE